MVTERRGDSLDDQLAPGFLVAPPPLDEARVQSLMTVIKNDPTNAGAAVQLANTYFDAERWEDAIQWYERALKINPNNPNASTALGVSYYYTNRPDHALDARLGVIGQDDWLHVDDVRLADHLG